MSGTREATARLRRGNGWTVKPEFEAVDGQRLTVRYGWNIGPVDSTIYAGEDAWIVKGPAEFRDLSWLASGDLEFEPE